MLDHSNQRLLSKNGSNRSTTPRVRCLLSAAFCLLILGGSLHEAFGQPLVRAWGNLEGIRVEGQLMGFETSLRVVGPDTSTGIRTAKEQQRPDYARDGNKQTISSRLDSLTFTEVVEHIGRGRATVHVQFTSAVDTTLAGAFFSITLPGEYYAGGTVELMDPASPATDSVALPTRPQHRLNEYVRAMAEGARFVSPHRQLAITFSEPTEITVKGDSSQANADIQVDLTVLSGAVQAGQTEEKTFTLEASGDIDRQPITFTLDPSQPGRAFDGLGGNFRLQNPGTDPKVIDYALNNLRVAWGRVEMPWRLWHPEESTNPIEAAEAGNLHPHVRASMEMARRLARDDIPVILAAWFAPDWAIIGERSRGLGPDGQRGNALDPQKLDAIHASIADYLVYLKKHYGVETEMFSFNESDLGIDVRQTAQEHADLIKALGAAFAKRDLKTKLVLGDVSDANAHAFIEPAMNDPATHPYIGAVSFHSWRGWETETLARWAAAADRLNIPLIVGEGSTDAAAWRYPAIFDEPSFAMEEIDLYTRILAICQPKSILQWQLTADYSILAGGGIFGNEEEPLRPTQRFWNLKQIASTPAGAFALPIASDRPYVNSAAFGAIAKGAYAIHVVNNGATRAATLAGLPDDVEQLRVYVTDHERGMKEVGLLPVSDGTAQFTLDAVSFTSLFSTE